MTRFPIFALALLLPGLAVAPLSAQQDPRSSLRDVQQFADYALVQRLDGALWGLGRAYSTRFDAAGPVFHPANRTARELVAVTLATTALGRGEQLLPVPPPAPPVEQERVVRYDRGPWHERYDVRPDGLKQSFVFDQIPAGSGDLVVAIQVKTPLPLRSVDAGAVAFGDDQLQVRIDGVVGIDGAGRRTTGSLAYANGTLSLRLPHAFVQQAMLPLVLDPLISTTTLATEGLVDSVHAAYDATTDKHLVVWCTGYGQLNNGEVRGWFVPGGPVLLASIADNRDVWVADNNLRDCFVVSWTLGVPNAFPFSGTQFGVRVCTARSPSQIGPVLSFFDPPPVSNRAMQIASNAATSLAGQDMATVYVHDDGAEMRSVRVQPDYSLVLANNRVTLTTSLVDCVGISRYGDDTNRYLIARGQRGPDASGTIVMQEYSMGGATLTAPLSVPAGAIVTSPWIGSLEIDGTHGLSRWSVLWGALGAYQYWPRMARVHRLGSTLDADPTSDFPTSAGGGGFDYALASTERTTVVVYPTRGLWHLCQQTPCWQWSVASVTNRGGCRTCRREAIADNITSPALVRPAAEGATYPGAAEDIRLFWIAENSLRMATYVPDDGNIVQLTPACGGLTATTRHACAVVGGTVYQSVLEGAPANQNFLVIGADRIDATCGGCTLVPDPFTGVVVTAPPRDATGDTWVDLTIPNLAGLVGLRVYQQWIVPVPQSPGCTNLGASFSAAHSIVLE